MKEKGLAKSLGWIFGSIEPKIPAFTFCLLACLLSRILSALVMQGCKRRQKRLKLMATEISTGDLITELIARGIDMTSAIEQIQAEMNRADRASPFCFVDSSRRQSRKQRKVIPFPKVG